VRDTNREITTIVTNVLQRSSNFFVAPGERGTRGELDPNAGRAQIVASANAARGTRLHLCARLAT
jgi:hypothetical protein